MLAARYQELPTKPTCSPTRLPRKSRREIEKLSCMALNRWARNALDQGFLPIMSCRRVLLVRSRLDTAACNSSSICPGDNINNNRRGKKVVENPNPPLILLHNERQPHFLHATPSHRSRNATIRRSSAARPIRETWETWGSPIGSGAGRATAETLSQT